MLKVYVDKYGFICALTMVKVAIVCTSTSNLKGFDTGVWMEELTAPYYIFTLADRYDVILASPAGGPIPIDTGSITDPLFTESSRSVFT
jgi:putative intracellular protease/amidase